MRPLYPQHFRPRHSTLGSGRNPVAWIVGLVLLANLGMPLPITPRLMAEPPVKPASQAWPLKRGPAPAWAGLPGNLAGALPVPREWLEEHGAVFLHVSSRHLLETDGTITVCTTEVVRLLGRKAIAILGDHRSILFDPAFEECTLHQAFAVAADGSRRELEARQCQVRDMITDYAVYDNQKQAILSFPGLQPGDTVVVQWTTRGKNPEYRGEMFGRHSVGMVAYPTLEEVLEVGVPVGKTLHAQATGTPTKHTTQGVDWSVWRSVRLEPLEVEDSQTHYLRDQEPHVNFSTFPTWQSVGTWQLNLKPDVWKAGPGVGPLVDQLVAGESVPERKAARLTHWVKRNIRYLSMGAEHHFTPHSPEDVLKNRHGDCKDTAQLLAAMLLRAGIATEIASLGVLGDGQVDSRVPSPWASHAVVVATINGRAHWIDTTHDLAAWNHLNEMDCDRQCYLVNAQGVCRLLRSPANTAADCQWVCQSKLIIRPDGTASLTRTIEARGEAAVSYRDAFLEEPPARRKKYLEDEMQELAREVVVSQVRVDAANLNDLEAPLRFECLAELKGLFDPPVNAGDMVPLSLTEPLAWDKWLSLKTRFGGPDKPLRLEQPFILESTIEVELTGTLKQTQPPEESRLATPWGTIARRVKADASGQKFVLRFRATRLPGEVAGPDRTRYLEFLEGARETFQALLPLESGKSP